MDIQQQMTNKLNSLIFNWFNEEHEWEKKNEAEKNRIPITEIHSELFRDALEASNHWRRAFYLIVSSFDSEATRPALYEGEGYEIKITDNYIKFTGKKAILIDSSVDLIEDEELICNFLEWLYEGGKNPLITSKTQAGFLELAGKTTNRTYPNQDPTKLNRKNNRKR